MPTETPQNARISGPTVNINMPREQDREGMRDAWHAWMEGAVGNTSDLITRDELVHRLAAEGIEVAPNDFRYWQTEGALPRPVKRWHNGATRALYPVWMVDVVRHLRRLQAEGYTLRYLGPRLLSYAQMRETASHPPFVDTEQSRDPSGDMDNQLRSIAADHERRTGIRIARVELRLIDEAGHPLTYTFPKTVEDISSID